jgi:hypothetical protein
VVDANDLKLLFDGLEKVVMEASLFAARSIPDGPRIALSRLTRGDVTAFSRRSIASCGTRESIRL